MTSSHNRGLWRLACGVSLSNAAHASQSSYDGLHTGRWKP